MGYQRGKIDLTTAVNYSAAAFAVGGAAALGAVGGPGVEGQNRTSIDGHAWGANLGALFNVLPTTRVGVHYRSLPEHPYYRTTFGWRPEDYPHAWRIGRQTVSLPLSPKLSNEDVEDVIRAVGAVLS